MWVLTSPVSVVCYILSVVGVLGAVFLAVVALPSVFFCVSGGIAIGGAQSGNKCLVVATMVMSIISALSALVFVIVVTFLSSVFFALFGQYHNSNYYLLLPIILGLLLVIVPTISASLTCQPLCCQKVVQPNRSTTRSTISTTRSAVSTTSPTG